jgi:hypothetical protein
MAFDSEKGYGRANYVADDKAALDFSSNDVYSPEPVQTYNNTVVSQDGGVMSKLRNVEARMDRKLGVESEAINRKRPEDKKHVPWIEQLTMALLWVPRLGIWLESEAIDPHYHLCLYPRRSHYRLLRNVRRRDRLAPDQCEPLQLRLVAK